MSVPIRIIMTILAGIMRAPNRCSIRFPGAFMPNQYYNKITPELTMLRRARKSGGRQRVG